MIDESSLATTRFALSTAATHCRTGACDWYHGTWSIVRLLDLGMTPARQLAFYREALASVAAGSRILVSGCADHAMLKLVADHLPCASSACDFTVVDRCRTPLELCRRYAEAAGFSVRTETSDLLLYGNDRPGAAPPAAGGFDLIVTHAFLGYFDDAARRRLFERWYALLAPGGRVLTVQRLRAGLVADTVRFSPRQKRDFTDSITSRSDELAPLGLDRHAVETMASTYCDRFQTYTIRSYEVLAEALGDCGFEVDTGWQPRAEPAAEPAVESGPAVAGDADYAFVVAQRPVRG